MASDNENNNQAGLAEVPSARLLDMFASRVRLDHYDPFGAEMDHGFDQDDLRDELLRRFEAFGPDLNTQDE